MTKLILFLAVLFIFDTKSWGQTTEEIQSMIAGAIHGKQAEWHLVYDRVAWMSSDSLQTESKETLKKLGKEWFCYTDPTGDWHAVYGKFENNRYEQVLHYHFRVKDNKLVKISDVADTSLVNSYSRALQQSYASIKPITDTVSIRFNHFIKRGDDSNLTVWILPAFQPNGVAVYGGEFIFTYDPAGRKLLKTDHYYEGKFRGFKADPPREIWLNYRDVEKPTFGAVFFAHYYKEYFTKIYIDNKVTVSSIIDGDEGKPMWVSVVKDKK